jgi:hypothetical protein
MTVPGPPLDRPLRQTGEALVASRWSQKREAAISFHLGGHPLVAVIGRGVAQGRHRAVALAKPLVAR